MWSGTVATSGIAGLTVGGGIGHLMRRFGATFDNLLARDVTTADGRNVRASQDENPELNVAATLADRDELAYVAATTVPAGVADRGEVSHRAPRARGGPGTMPRPHRPAPLPGPATGLPGREDAAECERERRISERVHRPVRKHGQGLVSYFVHRATGTHP